MANRKDLQGRPFNEAGFKAAMERIAKSRGCIHCKCRL